MSLASFLTMVVEVYPQAAHRMGAMMFNFFLLLYGLMVEESQVTRRMGTIITSFVVVVVVCFSMF